MEILIKCVISFCFIVGACIGFVVIENALQLCFTKIRIERLKKECKAKILNDCFSLQIPQMSEASEVLKTDKIFKIDLYPTNDQYMIDNIEKLNDDLKYSLEFLKKSRDSHVVLNTKDNLKLIDIIENIKNFHNSVLVLDQKGYVYRFYFEDRESLLNFINEKCKNSKNNQ